MTEPWSLEQAVRERCTLPDICQGDSYCKHCRRLLAFGREVRVQTEARVRAETLRTVIDTLQALVAFCATNALPPPTAVECVMAVQCLGEAAPKEQP
mgnify:CR=1 FL=1